MRILASPGMEVGDLNPYTRLLYRQVCQHAGHDVDEFRFGRAFTRKYDILHFHWPEYFIARPSRRKAYLGSASILLAALWGRIRGTKILWTVHNLHSHHRRRPRVERWFWRIFCWLLDGYIVLSERGQRDAELVHPRLGKVPGFVIGHGHYRGAYPINVSKSIARKWLNICREARVIAFFGSLSAYKGVAELVARFRELPDKNLVLLIAGEGDGSEEDWLASARADSRIKLHVGFVPSWQVQFYFLAADLVALPFKEIWNSGTALLALSFNRPILVPERSAFMELQNSVGREWVRMYRGQFTAEDLRNGVEWSREKRVETQAPLGRFEWRDIAEKTVEAYQCVLQGSHERLWRPVSSSRASVTTNQCEQIDRG
jgi:beta-1,4-mannosyltransferase